MSKIYGNIFGLYGGETLVSQDGWKDSMNSALEQIDLFMDLVVKDWKLSSPPSSPSVGDRYIVYTQYTSGVWSAATGAWLGREKEIVVWSGSEWKNFFPIKPNGFTATSLNEGLTIKFSGENKATGSWNSVSTVSTVVTIPNVGAVTGLTLQTITGAGSSATLDMPDYTTYASTKYVIQAKNKDTGDYQSCELMAFYYSDIVNNIEIGITEYARVIKDGLSPFIQFSVDINTPFGSAQEIRFRGTLQGTCSEAYVRIMKTMILK